MTNDPARIRTVAAKALSSVQRMGGMVSELLDSMAFHGGQKVSLELSAFDICELVREVQLDAVAHELHPGARRQRASTAAPHAAAIAAAKASTSSSVVSQLHIQRTSPVDSSQV